MSRYLQGNRLAIAAVIFLFVAIPLNAAIFLFSQQEKKHVWVSIQADALNIVQKQRLRIGGNFKHIVSDLLFFASYNELRDFYGDPEHKPHLIQDLALFSRGSKVYDQIRIINGAGMEVIRVNLTKEGVPVVVPEGRLQDKGKRYYFRDSIGLGQGEVFISPMDLNIERGEVEVPYKPMIRFATPIFGRAGGKQGVVVFNYLGEHMLDEFRHIASHEPGDIMLINSEGHWLAGRSPEEEWGFMFKGGEGRTLGNEFPAAWERIREEDKGQFRDRDGLFTFTTVYPLLEGWKTSTGTAGAFEPSVSMMKAKEYYWKVVSHVPPSYISATIKEHQMLYMYISLIVTLVMGAGAWQLARQDGLKAVITEKTLLLREIHHRVKNNLQVLLSLISVQIRYHADDEVAQAVLTENLCRLRAMVLAQDKLYAQEELARLDIKQYVEKVVESILSTCRQRSARINSEVSVDRVAIHLDKLVPCGMIINELVMNSVKHAFEGMKEGRVRVDLKKHGRDGIALEVSDNGRGLPEGMNLENSRTVGFLVLRSLVSQIGGEIRHVREEGTRFVITFSGGAG